MALLELKGITAGYGQNVILRDFNLNVERGEFVSLLGSSGCGKTTTLRLIAGFSEPMQGTISFDGRDYTHVPLHKRNFGFVFQSYALFPHMTVFDNVAFGLKMRKLDKAVIQRDVMQMLKLVDLEGFENRYPREMSGGQRQRVALARAMVISCFCPLEIFPPSPVSRVSYPCGKERMVWWMCAALAAAITSSRVTSWAP